MLLNVHLQLQCCAVGLLVHLALVRLEERGHTVDAHKGLHQEHLTTHVHGAEVHSSGRGEEGRGGEGGEGRRGEGRGREGVGRGGEGRGGEWREGRGGEGEKGEGRGRKGRGGYVTFSSHFRALSLTS